jgi:protein-disulfide isomerase
LAVAGELGLDPQVLRANLETDEVTATIDESMQLASALNLTGTPSYVTAKEVIVGAVGFDALRQRIEDARGCDTATC